MIKKKNLYESEYQHGLLGTIIMDLKGMRRSLLLFKVMKESLILAFSSNVVKVDSLFNSGSFGEYLRSFTYLCGTI